jgi:hypothetical protein
MKSYNKIILIVFSLLFSSLHAQIGIGTSTPDASAILDLSSTSKGLLMPRMTTLQQTALVSPAIGLTIFNTTIGQIQSNKGDGFGGALWVGDRTIGTTAPLGNISHYRICIGEFRSLQFS